MMRGAELYDRVVNWPNPMQLAVVLAVGTVLIMTAALLLSESIRKDFPVFSVVLRCPTILEDSLILYRS